MGKNKSDLGLYYDGLARSSAPLPVVLQHRITRHAESEKRPEVIVSLLGRADLDPGLVERFAAHRAAAVRVAWLQRHAEDPEVFSSYVASEKRQTVLATLVAQPELPDGAFNRIVERVEGVDLALAVLETKRLDNDDAEKLIARVADNTKLTHLPTQKRIRELAETYPALWEVIATTTESREVALESAKHCRPMSDELLDRLLATFVDVPLNHEGGSCPSRLEGYWDLIRTLRTHVELPVGSGKRLATTASALLERYGMPVKSSKPGWRDRILIELALIAQAIHSELPDTVEQLKERSPDSATQALSDVVTYIAKAPDKRRRSATVTGILSTIIIDDTYGPSARRRAVRVALENTHMTATTVVALFEKSGCTVDAEMFHAVWRSAWSRADAPVRQRLLQVTQNVPEALRYLVTEERFDPGSRLSDMEEAGVLNDELFELAANRVTARMLFEEIWPNKAVHARAIELVTEKVVAELGATDTAWEFFEACFDNVDTGIVELAQMAATST